MIIEMVHRSIQTTSPFMIGFLKPAEYPFPAKASVIISTSIPTYIDRTHPDLEIRNLAQRYMKRMVADEVGRPLGDTSGRCVENHTFLRCVGYMLGT